MKSIFTKYKPRAIFHFAAESHVDRSIGSPGQFVKTNINGTYSLLQSALHFYETEAQNFTFVHISTDEVFGSLGPQDDPFHENSPYNPNSPYSASKAAADHLVRCFNKTYGLPTLITNCSNNYGAYQHKEKFIPTILKAIVENKKIPVYGDGQQIRDWLFVGDHCDALLKLLDHGNRGESYNIGGACEKTNLELITSILEEVRRQRPDLAPNSLDDAICYVDDRLGHDRRYAVNIDKIANHIGWFPVVDFTSGIRKTVDWCIRNSMNL